MTTSPKEYVCPGERHAISRSVHLARLAAYYPKCRDCSFRNEIGHLPPRIIPAASASDHTVRRSLLTTEGFRGIFLNELNRPRAGELAGGFASLLWDRLTDGDMASSLPSRPVLVVGYDQRPSSPELVSGVFEALQQMGCGIVDLGPSITPHLWMSVRRLNATGGILVTGAGCDPSWNGLEFVGPAAVPVSRRSPRDAESTANLPSGETGPALFLEEIQDRAARPGNRPTRSAGFFRTLRNWEEYERRIQDSYHALRPLRVVVGSGSALLQRLAGRLFARLPCELVAVELPVRRRDLGRVDDADVVRVADAVRSTAAHVGVVFDDDGQQCAVLDETGELIPASTITRLLAQLLLDDQPDGPITLDESIDRQVRDVLQQRTAVHPAPPTRFGLWESMQRHGSVFGGEAAGRYWFSRSAGSVCDAFETLAHLLAALSRSDADCSQVIDRL